MVLFAIFKLTLLSIRFSFLQIFYGWLQIFTSLTMTFDIAWPMKLRTFSVSMGFINLDMGNMLSASACSFALPFLDKMIVHSIIPVMLLLAILIARIPAYFLEKKHRKKQKALMVKLISSLALILYPGLCTRLFVSLKTVTVNGLASSTHSGVVLAVDYSVEAFGETHMPYVYLTIVCMIVFVLGIPLSILLALKTNRKYLYTMGDTEASMQRHNDVVDEFGTLYLQCMSLFVYLFIDLLLFNSSNYFFVFFFVFFFFFFIFFFFSLLIFCRRTCLLVVGSDRGD